MTTQPDEHALLHDVGAVRVDRDVIEVRGPDTLWFLQGQLSQDIQGLTPGQGAWSFLLQPQGHVVAWFRATRLADDHVLLDVDAGWAPTVLERLERYRLRTKVELTAATWSVVAVRGPRTSDALADADPAVIVASAEWPGVDGVDLLAEDTRMPHGVRECSSGALEAVRIAAGVPAMGAELTDDVIPAEALVVERSVSFTKGCYTGQELVARVDSRGSNTPRRLRGLVIDAGAGEVGVGDELRAPELTGDDTVGVLTSVVWSPLRDASIALAYVKRAVDPSEASVAAVVGSARHPATIRTLPLR
ncbi:MAG: folate-binding protein YgfZ [Acidimicrobiales bacterium]|nr:folate-binding protein YgfZ [Acidimicrobiales bacterium]